VTYSDKKITVGEKTYNYPSDIVTPNTNQKDLFDAYMPHRIEAFINGLNVNVMAYGQTGSGKTHTMFGPPGFMAKAARGDFGYDIAPEYGMFPRGLITIYSRLQELKKTTQENFVVTVSVVELTLDGNLDMFIKSQGGYKIRKGFGANTENLGITLDRTVSPPRLHGLTELPLNEPKDLLKCFEAIASRNTSSTGLNDSSSRSHCFAFVNLYAKKEDKVRISRMQFVDLAGSERLNEAHGIDYSASNCKEAMQGLMVNYSLILLSLCMRQIVDLRKKGKPFAHMCKNIYYGDLVALLAQSLEGSAPTAMFICMSQAPANASQTRNALDFGVEFSKLRIDKLKPAPYESLNKLKTAAEKAVQENKIALEKSKGTGKYYYIRKSLLFDAQLRLEIFSHFD